MGGLEGIDRTGVGRRAFVATAAGAAAAAALAGSHAAGAQAQEGDASAQAGSSSGSDGLAGLDEVSVRSNGTAQVLVMPDLASMSFSALATDADAQAAAEQASAIAQRTTEALAQAGVADESVQTSGVSVYPTYDQQPDAMATGTGAAQSQDASPTFQASVYFELSGIAIDSLPDVTEAILGAGVTQVDAVSYQASDTTQAYLDALAQAVARATDSARAICRSLGRELTAVSEVDEQTTADPEASSYATRSYATSADSSMATGISPSVAVPQPIEVGASVSMVCLAR
ncbi:MAG: SIMPL domain-containing protein [Coriobacteriales bacterium]|jgi:uncharacterized protein YggE